MNSPLQTVIIGGGQAGLATSRALQERTVEHVLLERGQLGESWRAQRWDSFRLNTPGWANGLPGMDFSGSPDGFGSAGDLVRYFEAYRDRFQLPVRTGITVSAVRRDGAGFTVEAGTERFTAPHVVVASGIQNRPRIPAIASELAPEIVQLHSAEYRNPAALRPGRVLLVGTAQTGCQIAEDLLGAGREVLMATGRAPRVPRRYRGRDIIEWLMLTGFFTQRRDEVADPAMLSVPQPQVSGVDGGHTVSYQDLAKRGVRLLGRLTALDGTHATFAGDLREHVRFADELSARIVTSIDLHIVREGIDAPPNDPDPADAPARYEEFSDEPAMLDLNAESVTSVIWCTGFGGDFSWLPEGATRDGLPLHHEGIGELAGLYFVGFPWLVRRYSGIIVGVVPDAARIAETIAGRLARSA